MPKTKIFKELIVKKKFKSYTQFHNENKEKIYKSVIELFKEFQNTRSKNLTLVVGAKIENVEWSTELTFNKNEFYVLKKDIMPYFEKIEDYETCSEIINLMKSLT